MNHMNNDKKLLLIVDVQNGFISDKTSHIIKDLKELLEKKYLVMLYLLNSQIVKIVHI